MIGYWLKSLHLHCAQNTNPIWLGGGLTLGGHEGAGEVVEVARPGPVAVGDRVVILPQYPCGECSLCLSGDGVFCENNLDFETIFGTQNGRGAFAQYLLAPSWRLRIIPEDVSYEHATMAIDGIGATFGAFQELDINATDTLLITGLGPVGLGGVANALFAEPGSLEWNLLPGEGTMLSQWVWRQFSILVNPIY